MKKETFVKLIDSLLDAQIRREELNDRLCEAVSKRSTSGEKIDLRDLVYDSTIEDSIIDAIELEFGEKARDRVADYIYEEHDVFERSNVYYNPQRTTEDLYDEILNLQ